MVGSEIKVTDIQAGCVLLHDHRHYDVPQQRISALYVAEDAAVEVAVRGAEPQLLQPGDLICIPLGDAHALRLPNAARLGRTTLQPPFRRDCATEGRRARVFAARVPAVANPLPDLVPHSFVLTRGTIEDHQPLSDILGLIRSEANSPTAADRRPILNRLAEIAAIILLEIILEWHRDSGLNTRRGVADPQLRKALQTIHDSPAEAWTLAGLAAVAGVSRSVFAQRFREAIGQTPMHYLTRVRINAAARLLQQQGLSVSEVAWRAGYQSDAAFNKAFRRVLGCSPTDYRRHAHKSSTIVVPGAPLDTQSAMAEFASRSSG